MPPEVRDAWLEASQECWLNPSAPYLQASSVRVRLEAARERLAGILGCYTEEVVFNSGATEGNNAVFSYLNRACPEGQRVLVGAVEHPSVREPALRLPRDKVEWLEVGSDGVSDLVAFGKRLESGEVFAVSIMAANNETGVLQPWQEIRDICRAAGVVYHCDAVQWLGKLPADGLGGCDFATGCAHKFGGPKGCGFLKIPGALQEFSFLAGGEQEAGHRAGTENYPSVAAMLEALECCRQCRSTSRDIFEATILEMIPGTVVVGRGVPRLWNTSMLILPGFANTRWVNRLSRRDYLVSTGSACATAKEGSSHVLAAMGVGSDEASRAVRVSCGWSSTKSHWVALAEAFTAVHAELVGEKTGPDIGITVVDP